MAFGGVLWASGHHGAPAAVLVAGSMALAASAVVSRGRGLLHARQAAMAIVPWGVVVEPDTQPRILRWPGIRRVTVQVSHAMRGGTPIAVHSIVSVDTGREILAGRAPGAVGLEALTVNLDAYASEAARPIALDLAGLEEAGDGATEPVVDALFVHANDLCTSGRGAAALALPPGGYRGTTKAAPGPETVSLLRAILRTSPEAGADARPLAAAVAALLGARELVPELLRLASAPHPVVAAVARAAALRLGAPQSRAGAIAEVGAFLFDEDRDRLERWAAA
jgi:hypothetical protein